MLFSTVGQIYVLLASVYAGAAMGAAYEALALLRRVLGGGVAVSAVFDMLFWGCACVLACLSAILSNGGDIRLFMLGGYALGFAVFRLSIGRLLRWVVAAIGRALSRVKKRLGKKPG